MSEAPEGWFDLCCNLVFEAGKDVPRDGDITCHLPPKIDGVVDTHRFSAEWRHDGKHYGFVIKWKGFHFPPPWQIASASKKGFENPVDIGYRERFLGPKNTIWIGE